jgi:hypothetical protein
MIDLKLNELPVDAEGDFENNPKYTEAEKAEIRRRRQARGPDQGLSVNETIAAGAAASVGARGVGTSGTESGAGAGARMTKATPPKPGESTMPDIPPPADRARDL